MEISLKISIVRLIIIQLIPIIGLIFFEWQLFDIAMFYLLESIAMFLVFVFDQSIVRKDTRSMRSMGFMFCIGLPFFGGIMFAYILVLYAITGESIEGGLETTLFPKLAEMRIWTLLFVLTVIEFVVFYVKIKKELKHPDDNFWRVMSRFLYFHLFVIAGIMILMATIENLNIVYECFLILRLCFDLFQIRVESQRRKKFANKN